MYLIRSLVPFDMIIDTDLGLIKHIQAAFQGNDLYYPGIMEMLDYEFTESLEAMLVLRRFANPLSIIIKEEKMLTCDPDKMLSIFFDQNYDSIIKLSSNTAIMKLLCKSLFLSDSLKFTILCKTDIEKDELLRRLKLRYGVDNFPITILIESDRSKIRISDYDNLYIKDIHDISSYNKKAIKGKNIIIANYNFNKETESDGETFKEIPLLDIISEYSGNNKISFIDVYPRTIKTPSVG